MGWKILMCYFSQMNHSIIDNFCRLERLQKLHNSATGCCFLQTDAAAYTNRCCVCVCSVWSSDGSRWHSRSWHAELYEGRKDDSWQAGFMLSSVWYQWLVTRTWWIHHGMLLLLLLLLLLTEAWWTDAAALKGTPWHQHRLSRLIRQNPQRRIHVTKNP